MPLQSNLHLPYRQWAESLELRFYVATNRILSNSGPVNLSEGVAPTYPEVGTVQSKQGPVATAFVFLEEIAAVAAK